MHPGAIEWTKLYLVKHEGMPEYIRDSPQLAIAKQQGYPLGLQPVNILADYITILRHAVRDNRNINFISQFLVTSLDDVDPCHIYSSLYQHYV